MLVYEWTAIYVTVVCVRQWKHKRNKILIEKKIKPRSNQTQQQSHN
jgi:hypothetical protein